MKKAYVILFVVMVVTEVSATSDSLYQKANGLYQQGEYETALNIYRDIINAGFESSGLYYNMGNAAYRSNSIGYSILYYEKTLKLDPSHEDAIHNLEYVSRYRVDTFEQVPELFIRSWTKAVVRSFSEQVWSILAIVLFMMLLGSVFIYLFSQRLVLKKAGFFIAMIGLALFIISLSSALAQHRNIIRPDAGIILSPSVIIRSSPSESGTELFILHEGTRVRVNEEVSGWHNIRVIDGREGWVQVNDFESI
ncbi:MAG: SH3 domain-containing protein [Bacteroidales bacterium]|nr:SH3 domain-containing protein [Bacteroidales bacterium]